MAVAGQTPPQVWQKVQSTVTASIRSSGYCRVSFRPPMVVTSDSLPSPIAVIVPCVFDF
jgi:hypothetical protein